MITISQDGKRMRDEGEFYVARDCQQIADEMYRRHGIKMSRQAVSQTLLRGIKKMRIALRGSGFDPEIGSDA